MITILLQKEGQTPKTKEEQINIKINNNFNNKSQLKTDKLMKRRMQG